MLILQLDFAKQVGKAHSIDLYVLFLLQPNAEQQFLEVKNAFQVLSDAQQRAQYDRKLKGVSSSSKAPVQCSTFSKASKASKAEASRVSVR